MESIIHLSISLFRKAINQIVLPVKALKSRIKFAWGIYPLSYEWGHDRGCPIHRYFINRFLGKFSDDIRGHCLEFEQDLYASRYGKGKIKKLDILHKEKGNPNATIIADFTKPNQIPGGQFDCIICTHVLHIIFELDVFVSELHRILKPGGALLIAVPHVSMCEPSFHELWRFTPEGLRAVLSKTFGENNVTICAYGNSLSTAADFRGLVAQELKLVELEYHDERFALEVCARAIK